MFSRGTAGFDEGGAVGAATTRGDARATMGTDEAGRDTAGDAAAAPATRFEVAPSFPASEPV